MSTLIKYTPHTRNEKKHTNIGFFFNPFLHRLLGRTLTSSFLQMGGGGGGQPWAGGGAALGGRGAFTSPLFIYILEALRF